MLHVAHAWFALDRLGPMEFLCADALDAARALARVGRRFDYVMEDAAYAEAPERARPLAEALVDLVAPAGTLVVNRHWRGDAHELAAAFRPRFLSVRLRRVRREGENVLLFCERPIRPRREGPRAAAAILAIATPRRDPDSA